MVPDWLADVFPVNKEIADRVAPAIINYVKWTNTKNAIIKTEKDAKTALILEITGKHRPLMVERIKHMYNVIRHRREIGELYRSELVREAYRKQIEGTMPEKKVDTAKIRKPGSSRGTRQNRNP